MEDIKCGSEYSAIWNIQLAAKCSCNGKPTIETFEHVTLLVILLPAGMEIFFRFSGDSFYTGATVHKFSRAMQLMGKAKKKSQLGKICGLYFLIALYLGHFDFEVARTGGKLLINQSFEHCLRHILFWVQEVAS